MIVKFAALAYKELEEAIIYYDIQQFGLGNQFKREIDNLLELILMYPLAGQKESKRIRRLMLSRFPYKILYAIEGEMIYVVALANLHRVPDYWIDRS